MFQPKLVAAVDEFFTRLFEEMDYVGEVGSPPLHLHMPSTGHSQSSSVLHVIHSPFTVLICIHMPFTAYSHPSWVFTGHAQAFPGPVIPVPARPHPPCPFSRGSSRRWTT